MSKTCKAVHPVKVGRKTIPPGGSIDPEQVGETRLARLIEKGRVSGDAPDPAPVNRAESAGRPGVKLPDKDGKA